MSCYTYQHDRLKGFTFVPRHDMQNSFRIFILVSVLLAKFTLSFFGQGSGSDNSFTESIANSKQNTSHVDALCFVDENESRVESDDDNDDHHFLVVADSIESLSANLQRIVFSSFAGNCLVPVQKLFILLGNFRL